MIRRFTVAGYAHLYRSLMRFCRMRSGEASSFVSQLRAANVDSYCRAFPLTCVEVPAMDDFCFEDKRPYFTEVQLYKALQVLEVNICWRGLSRGQKENVRKLRCVIKDIAEQFWKAYGVEIEDECTVYADCASSLEPGGKEPCVCLREHWCMDGGLLFSKRTEK